MIDRRRQLVVIGIFSFLVYKGRCFHLTDLKVPPIQDPREDMNMICQFDMGGEELFAVKWYKDDQEFFKYTPSLKSFYTIFPVNGVSVDGKRSRCDSTQCNLILFNLTRFGSSGAYRCEVSSEAPSFRLVSKTKNVTVAVIPEEYPQLKSLQNTYYINDILFASCTSGAGDPKPTVNFFINRLPAPPSATKVLHTEVEEDSTNKRIKLERDSIQLRLMLDKQVMGNDTMLEIVCVSSVEGINQNLYTPLATTRNVIVLDPQQNVKNQKFYWPTSTAVSIFRVSVCTITCTVLFSSNFLGLFFRYFI